MKSKILISMAFMLLFVFAKTQSKKYSEAGWASFYADKFEGRQTANGEIYYHAKKTAAHRNLPFGSILKVTNLENKKFVLVRINDRGPFINERIVDLSKSAAKDLDFVEKGLVKVQIELIASTDDLPDKPNKIIQQKSKTEYYNLNVQSAEPKGKGLQIGSYSENENVFRLAEKLREKYQVDIFVEIAENNGKKVYRVMLGNYTNKYQLENLKKQLLSEYPDCFIVSYKD